MSQSKSNSLPIDTMVQWKILDMSADLQRVTDGSRATLRIRGRTIFWVCLKKCALHIPTGSNRMIIISPTYLWEYPTSFQSNPKSAAAFFSCKGSCEVPAPFSSSIQDGYLEVGEIMQAPDGGWDLSEITHGWYVSDMSVICQWYYS